MLHSCDDVFACSVEFAQVWMDAEAWETGAVELCVEGATAANRASAHFCKIAAKSSACCAKTWPGMETPSPELMCVGASVQTTVASAM